MQHRGSGHRRGKRSLARTASHTALGVGAFACLVLAGSVAAQQQQTATFQEVVATYDAADQKQMGSMAAVKRMTGQPDRFQLMLPKGSDIFEVQVYGNAQGVSGLRLVYKDGGDLMMTALAGNDGGLDPKALRLGANERIIAVLTRHTDERLLAIRLETNLGRSLTVGAPGQEFDAQASVIGRVVGFNGNSGRTGLGALGVIIHADTPGAQKIASQATSTGELKSADPSMLGYAAGDRLVRGSNPDGSQTPYTYAPGDSILIPRDAELAGLVVYGDAFINGVQLAYRPLGASEMGLSKVLGAATGPIRRLTLPPGQKISSIIVKSSNDRVLNMAAIKEGGEIVTFGDWDASGAPITGGQQFDATEPNRTFGLVGLLGTQGANGMSWLMPIRLPTMVGPVSGFKGAPSQAASGCAATANAQNVAQAGATPIERLTAMRSGQIGVAAQFAIPLDATQSVMAGRLGGVLPEECRYDVSGTWASDSLPSLRPTPPPAGEKMSIHQGTESGANGNFVDRSYLVISALDPDHQLVVYDGMGNGGRTILNSTDGKSLRDVLDLATGIKRPDGSPDEKTYGTGADMLRISVGDIDGVSTIKWRGVTYKRPTPSVLQPQALAINDSFTVHQALDNLPAARRGYDIALDNPFEMNLNALGLKPIFAIPDPKLYVTIEKTSVPLGLLYVANGGYGMSFTETLITNQSDLQKSVSNTYGASIGYGGKNNAQQEAAGKQQPSASVAVSYSESQMNGSSHNQGRSLAMTIARDKKYSVILDRPFARLEPSFVQAIYNYDRSGDIWTFVKQYGTHYPFAVTYGAASKSIETFSHQETANWSSASKDLSVKLSGSFRGVDGSVSYDRKEEQSATNKVAVDTRRSDLQAQCATNKEASGLGKECPILFDLRPMHELISPLNFPNDPEFVTRVRAKLERDIRTYLDSQAAKQIVEQPPQVWNISLSGIKCSDVGQEAVVWDKAAELRGVIDFTVSLGQSGTDGYVAESAKGLDQSDGEMTLECDGKVKELLGTVAFWGTPEEMQRAKLRTWINWLIEVDGVGDPDDIIVDKDAGTAWILESLPISGAGTATVGQAFKATQSIARGSDSSLPTLELEYSFKRVK